MALKHFKQFLGQTQADYYKLLKMLEQLEKEYLDGKATQEMVDSVRSRAATLKENFTRVSYIGYLMSLPQRDKKKKKFDAQHKELVNFVKNGNTLEEDKFILQDLENILKQSEDKK